MSEQKILIEILSDDHDCDTCGYTYAQGAKVTLDGKEFLMLEPVSACFGGDDYDYVHILTAILEKLGYQVEFC